MEDHKNELKIHINASNDAPDELIKYLVEMAVVALKTNSMDIRNRIITGTFAIGHDGRKEPTDWKEYAIRLESHIDENESRLAPLQAENEKLWELLEEEWRAVAGMVYPSSDIEVKWQEYILENDLTQNKK